MGFRLQDPRLVVTPLRVSSSLCLAHLVLPQPESRSGGRCRVSVRSPEGFPSSTQNGQAAQKSSSPTPETFGRRSSLPQERSSWRREPLPSLPHQDRVQQAGQPVLPSRCRSRGSAPIQPGRRRSKIRMHPEGCGSSKTLASNEHALAERWQTACRACSAEASSGFPAQLAARPSASTRPTSGRSHVRRARDPGSWRIWHSGNLPP
jgi:hypothetical protein